MFHSIKSKVVAAAAAVGGIVTALPAHAALTAEQATTITSGITGSDSTFYSIGGTVLVVLAGIWGFKKVQGLLQGR